MIPATRGAILVGLLAPLFAAGCFSPNSVTCGDGRICPPDSRCDEQRNRCIPNAQMLPCVGLAEFADCTFANAAGACRRGVCEVFFCGDGSVTGLEACDGAPPPGKSCLDYGFDRGLLGCSATCQPALEGCSSFSSWADWPIPSASMCPGTERWNGVWASSADDVHVVGWGILHWDGSTWSTAMLDGYFNDVWGSGPNDVYAVGETWVFGPGSARSGPSTVVHWDGSRWSEILSGGPFEDSGPKGVWGSGPNDVYVVGGTGSVGVMMRWTGTGWNRITDPALAATSTLAAVWGTGPKDLYVAGLVPDETGHGKGAVFHSDGSSWTEVDSLGGGFLGFAGSAPNDVFAVGAGPNGSGQAAHWDGTSWSAMPGTPEPLHAAWAGGRGEVFAVGLRGTVFQWDGASWLVSRAGGNAAVDGRPDIIGTAGSIFVVANGRTGWRRERLAWSPVASTAPSKGIWASGPDDAYAVGVPAMSHWDGTRWSPAEPTTIVPSLNSVWGSGPNDVFGVGDGGVVVHWNGSSWSRSDAGPAFCPADSEIGQVGELCPPQQDGVLGDLVGVSGSGARDAFAVSAAPTSKNYQFGWALAHWNGVSWSTLLASPFFRAKGVWASGPEDVFIVGNSDGGSVLRWNGAVASSMTLPGATSAGAAAWPYTPIAVWGSGRNDVYAVGGRNSPNVVTGWAILHWDGARWSDVWGDAPFWSDTTRSPAAVGGSGAGDVFAGGGTGVAVLLHRRSGTWEPVRVPGLAGVSALSVTPGRVFVLGYNGEVHLDRPSITCVGPERECNDGWDNDCDGLQDVADPDCAGKVAEQCANLADDDGDGKADCADPDCADFPSCTKMPVVKVPEQCVNLVDDDGDGLVDCADPDCFSFPSCEGTMPRTGPPGECWPPPPPPP